MAEKQVTADEIFKEFKEHSISQFFRKNAQMLGYAGKVRSLTTIIHEYVSNALDACEEAGILPDISVEVKQLGEEKYSIRVTDNGPGIPPKLVGKALATVLAGTKFHRYIQQRGQQGIGAAGCTMFAQITSGKPIKVASGTSKQEYECEITIDIKSNKPVIDNMQELKNGFKGLSVYGEFGDVKYESSDHGVYEYLRRTALSNPHANINLLEPDGKEVSFPRSAKTLPKRPKLTKPHPLGIGTSDLLDFAHVTESRKVSSFLVDTFSRVTQNKVDELRSILKDFDFDNDPRKLSWAEAEQLVGAFRQIKWIAPDLDSLSTIGEEQVKATIKNILNPAFMSVVERKPKVFRGGIPFVVESGIAYGGSAGRQTEEGVKGTTLRFANKVPLLFDGSSCAISQAVNSVDWKRYGIKDFDQEPISVMINVSSVYVPYSGVGKQAIAQEPEIIEEIKLAVQDCARALQRHISNQQNMTMQATKYNTIIRYVNQLALNLSEITDQKQDDLKKRLREIIDKRYKHLVEAEAEANEAAEAAESSEEEKEESEEG